MYKKVRRTCKVFALPTKPIVFFYAFDVVASSDRKIPSPVFNVAVSYTKKLKLATNCNE